ncbi:hypothetical protein NBRC116188_17100 [Oceaniserpentilla sp. 4NH20-0058]|uniref:hypothetical protein n=1 Tax=Oceaniserpentilla sp. 4NH20-0058 TaxID=3127660 RepID=UPI0031077513
MNTITLDESLHDQLDLKELCKPNYKNHAELYSPNDNYGFAYYVKQYANYPIEKPINAILPHGIYFQDKVVAKSELNSPMNSVLCYPPFIKKAWKKSSSKKTLIDFSSPIHYSIRLYENEYEKSKALGSIVMLPHRTKVMSIKYDYEQLLLKIDQLPDFMKPVTICIHWLDVGTELEHQLRAQGFNIVCAGHFTDYRFIHRWLHLVKQHKVVIGVGLGSSLFYSIVCGTPYYHMDLDINYDMSAMTNIFNKKTTELSPESKRKVENLKSIFSKPSEVITDQQKQIVDWFTQKQSMLTPKNLYTQLDQL